MTSADFINWTNALMDYFFSRDSEEEVFLYVDEQILDQIGKDNELGDHQSFLNTFLVPIDDRITLYDELYLHENKCKPRRSATDNSTLRSPNILKFAKYLREKIQNAEYYFPYAVLVMYYASQTINEGDRAIGRYLYNIFGNYDPIVDLFGWVHNDHPEFKNKLKTQQNKVGLIKYQLLLSPAEIREINEALYRVSYKYDLYLSYVDKILKIKDFVNDHVKSILKESLTNSDYQHRIKSIIDEFDLEAYKAAHKTDNEVGFREYFALYLDFSQGRHFRLLSSYRPAGKKDFWQGDNHFTFTPSIDSIDTYNNEYVECNGKDTVVLKEYSLRTDKLEIKPIPLGDVVFFYKHKEQKYLQSRDAYNKKVYIFVKKGRQDKKLEDWNKWAEQNTINCRRIDDEEVCDLIEGGWALYVADGLLSAYYNKEDGWNLTNRVRSISLNKKSGFLVGKNTYLINALPFFEFPEEIKEEGLSVKVKMENQTLSKDDGFRYFIQGNRLILDLIKDIDYEESRKIEVGIEYTNPITSEQLNAEIRPGENPFFYVRGQNIVYNQQELYHFNKWGEKTDETNRIIQGNIISDIAHKPLSGASHVIETNNLGDIPLDYFYFINLLASSIYSEPNKQIARDKLEKCIQYAATRLNLEANEDGFVTKVISLLVNSGYLAADYRESCYQAIPPSFTKIPRAFHVGGYQIWMLTGTYTRRFLNELVDYCNSNNISLKLRYSKKLDHSRGSLKLLPPIILVGHNFNPQSFHVQYPHHCFDTNATNDQALDLLSLLPSITEYSSTLGRVPRDRVDVSLFVRPKSNEFPRIREDNPYAYNNHIYIEKSEDGDFLKPSISEKWHELYCYYKRNVPFVIKGTQHIYLPEDLRLPSLIQRSLFIMNVGVPKYQNAFICGSPSSKLYTRMKSYKVNDARLQTVYEKLTGNSNVIDNPHIREKVISSRNNREGNWQYRMTLWNKKENEELNDKIPDKLLVLQYDDIRYNFLEIIAISTYYKNGNIKKTYVRRNSRFLEVSSESNSIMSFIIQNPRWQNNQIPFSNNHSEFTLTISDHYDIEDEDIMIL